MKPLNLLFVLLTAGLFTACGGSPNPDAQEQEQLRNEVQDVVNERMQEIENELEEVEPEASAADSVAVDSAATDAVPAAE